MLTIQPQYLSLSKLFDGRLFRIPEYQRAYSWTKYQRTDLFEDIEKTNAKGPQEIHFMAAVVCLRRGALMLGTDEFHKMEVVDGQQRLTTLIMLFNAIRLALGVNEKSEVKLQSELQELLIKTEGDELLLLQTNHDSSHHFANFLRKGIASEASTAQTIADRELLAGIEDCKQFVSKWTQGGKKLSSLLTLLKNR